MKGIHVRISQAAILNYFLNERNTTEARGFWNNDLFLNLQVAF